MDNLAEYRKILANIPHWVLALRSRHTIEDCDSAEKIELVALTHCLGDGAARRLGNEVYASLAKLLSDDRSRDQARKVALASTWWASQRFSNSNRDVSMELGSYNMRYLLYDSDLQLSNRDGYIPSSIELRRARDLFVSDLWSLLELSPENVQAMTENQHPIRRFSRRADWGLTDLVDGVLNLQSTAPASAWRGAWESIAKQLPPEVSDHE
jgi:hypothetical protein